MAKHLQCSITPRFVLCGPQIIHLPEGDEYTRIESMVTCTVCKKRLVGVWSGDE